MKVTFITNVFAIFRDFFKTKDSRKLYIRNQFYKGKTTAICLISKMITEVMNELA